MTRRSWMISSLSRGQAATRVVVQTAAGGAKSELTLVCVQSGKAVSASVWSIFPIALYPATRKEGAEISALRERDHSPVNYKRVAEKDGKEVPWDQIVKGYEYREGEIRHPRGERFSARRSGGDPNRRHPGLRRAGRNRSEVFLQAVLPRTAKGRRQSLRPTARRFGGWKESRHRESHHQDTAISRGGQSDEARLVLELMHFANELSDAEKTARSQKTRAGKA